MRKINDFFKKKMCAAPIIRKFDLMDQGLVLQIVDLFSPTDMHLSEFKDAVKILITRSNDLNLKQIANQLLIKQQGVYGWKEIGNILLILIDESGLNVHEVSSKNMYLRLLIESEKQTCKFDQRLTDEEYADIIIKRIAEVTGIASE